MITEEHYIYLSKYLWEKYGDYWTKANGNSSIKVIEARYSKKGDIVINACFDGEEKKWSMGGIDNDDFFLWYRNNRLIELGI